ncbi:hypothetical protein JJC00_13400 [Bradyrhizobium diazoefficiens]|nr:hypothetical protein JJC00_13400 [Bradyrhizobium diazoefficiens]
MLAPPRSPKDGDKVRAETIARRLAICRIVVLVGEKMTVYLISLAQSIENGEDDVLELIHRIERIIVHPTGSGDGDAGRDAGALACARASERIHCRS